MIMTKNFFPEWIRPFLIKGKTEVKTKNSINTLEFYKIGDIPFEYMISNNVPENKKWKVNGTCNVCGKKFTTKWITLCRRKYSPKKEICGHCALIIATSSKEWLKKNSDSQKKSQCTPEARKRMSDIVRNRYINNPELRVKMSLSLKKMYECHPEIKKKISDKSKKNWEDKEYQSKVTGKGFYHGYYLSKYGKIYFASSWELMFLFWCDHNKIVTDLSKNTDSIEYLLPNNKIANYHPDFNVVLGGKPLIIEIKGFINDIDIIERKRLAAESFYHDKEYCILFKKDLERLGVFKKSGLIRWIENLCSEGKIEEFGAGKYRNEESFRKLIENNDKKKNERINKINNNKLGNKFPDLLNEWNYEKNQIDPFKIQASDKTKVWWICSVCGFEWESGSNNRTKKNPCGCPLCAKERTRVAVSAANRKRFLEKQSLRDKDKEKMEYLDSIKNIYKNTNKIPTRSDFLKTSDLPFVRLYELFGSYGNLTDMLKEEINKEINNGEN